MLATDCYLSDTDWHDLNHRIYVPGNKAPITLADNVWIGDEHITSRPDLFNMNQNYDEFEAQYFRQLLSANTLSKWLRVLMWPSDQD